MEVQFTISVSQRINWNRTGEISKDFSISLDPEVAGGVDFSPFIQSVIQSAIKEHIALMATEAEKQEG